MNDPREMAIRPESGVTLEQDNRVETMYHWGAMVVDYCDLPVSEYMKPMQVIVLGGEMPDTGSTMYTLKFVIDGETVLTQELCSGDVIPFEVNPEKEGRNFTGWYFGSTKYEEGMTMPARNITLTAKYECEVTFVFNIEGEETIVSSYTLTYNSKLSNIPNTNKEGYVFKGWEPSTTEPVTAHTTYVGVFEVQTFTITWSGYTDGPITETYKYGDTLVIPESPEKEGYTFSYWSPNVEDIVTKDVTYVANFKINSYTVEYFIQIDGEEGDAISSVTVNYNATIPSKSIPFEKGYTFTNWKGYNAVTNEEFNGTKMPAFNLKYVTVRTTNEYVLSYFDNNEFIKSDTYLYGETIIPFTYQKEGWTVSEWSNLPTTMPYENVSAHCTSTINEYKITFIDQNGTEYVVLATYGTPIKDVIPNIEGKTFNVSEDILNSTLGPNDMEINGNVTINNYDVLVNVDGEEGNLELPYGTNVEEYFKEIYPEKEGYTLKIESNYETVPANDSLKVVITYVVNVWVLSYSTTGAKENINGLKEVEFGANILENLPLTEKDGYVFGGWFNNEVEITEESTMPNNDFEVIGNYEILKYSVTIFDGNDMVFENVYEYGTLLNEVLSNENVVEYIESTSANGYTATFTYNGENVDGNMMITEDIVINTTKTPNKYTITFKNDNEIITAYTLSFGETIEYPTLNGYTDNGIEYVFVWEDNSYNGATMPAKDITVVGYYQEKAAAPIYYGSFVTPQSSYTEDNISKYFNVSDLSTEYYQSIEVAKCMGNGSDVYVVMPPYAPFADLSTVKEKQEAKKYYEPPTMVIPKSVVDNYTISVIDGVNNNVWSNFITDKKVITIDGNEYYFYCHKPNETLIPSKKGDGNLKYTIKIN